MAAIDARKNQLRILNSSGVKHSLKNRTRLVFLASTGLSAASNQLWPQSYAGVVGNRLDPAATRSKRSTGWLRRRPAIARRCVMLTNAVGLQVDLELAVG